MKRIKSRIKKLEDMKKEITISEKTIISSDAEFEEDQEALIAVYPDHKWFELPLEERKRIWNIRIPPEYTDEQWEQLLWREQIEACKNSKDPDFNLSYEIHNLVIPAHYQLLMEEREKENRRSV